MPISAISAASRSSPPGSRSCCPRCAQLFRAGRARARQSEGDRAPVLPDVSRMGAAADGRAGDGGDRDRQPGGDHRRLFADPAGHAARPAAAPRDPAHVGNACRARSTCRASTLLLVGVLLLVALFRSSSALASAYGISVTGKMVVTALMAFVVIWKFWKWSPVGRGGADRAVPADRPRRSSAPTCSRSSKAAGCRSRSAARSWWSCSPGGAAAGYCSTRPARHEIPLDAWSPRWRRSRRCWCRARRCSSPAIPTARRPR